MATNHPKSGRSNNVTQKGAEKTKRYCTSPTLQASVSMLNVKIQDKIVIKEAISMACSGGAEHKNIFLERRSLVSQENITAAHYTSQCQILGGN